MKKYITKITNAQISMKLLAIGAVLFLLVVLFPIVRIMTNCVPWYDDFSYGRFAKHMWEIKHSFGDALNGAFTNVKQSWYSWQGTYTSCFFMSMMPAIWGTDKYVLGLWFVLAVLILGVFCLVHVLLKEVIKSNDKWANLAVQALVAATVVLFMRSAIEGFFWYNSAVHYTAMHGFGMLFIAGLLKLIYAKSKWSIGLLIAGSLIGAVMVGGANNVTVLQVGLVVLSILGFGLIFRNKNVLRIIPAGVVYAVAMYMNLSAPGNARRMQHYLGLKLSVPEAVLRSFQSAFTHFWDFTGLRTFVIVAFMVPVAWYLVKKSKFTFRYPALVAIWSFCLYAAGFAPTMYTMGHALLGRATNMVKVSFQLLLFINLFYLLGWFCRYLEKKGMGFHLKNTWCYHVITAIIMIVIFVAEPNKGGMYSSYCAYYFVHTGEAYNYYQEYLDRVEICESNEPDVIVRPYVFKPWLLCLGDLSGDPSYEPNYFMALYFGKNSIVCIEEEE